MIGLGSKKVKIGGVRELHNKITLNYGGRVPSLSAKYWPQKNDFLRVKNAENSIFWHKYPPPPASRFAC